MLDTVAISRGDVCCSVVFALDTVVIPGDDVCCSVVFGTLVGVLVFI